MLIVESPWIGCIPFTDNFEKGYAAAVFDNGLRMNCYLITAKSNVSPLNRMNIPRLKLCGALLAAKLINSVNTILKDLLKVETMHAWTDSTITLASMKSSSHWWTVFVANRTSHLQVLTISSIWRMFRPLRTL